jgi:hypothetical protein
MITTNYAKQYAIYFRVNETIKDLRQRYLKINISDIYRQIADEFGFELTRQVVDAVNFIKKNRTSPHVKKAILLFSENRIDHWGKYNTEKDFYNIDIIKKNIPATKNTRTSFIYYFIYMRFTELTPPFSIGIFRSLYRGELGDIYDKIADEFYYTDPNSIRNIIKKIGRLSLQFKIKQKKQRKKKQIFINYSYGVQLTINFEL